MKEQTSIRLGWLKNLLNTFNPTTKQSPQEPKKTQELLILRGLPGSGKTTFAREWVREDGAHRVRVNRDDIRRMLGPYWIPSREKLVTSIEIACVNHALRLGYSVVSDNTNFTTKVSPTNFYGKITFKMIDTPIEECIIRDSRRGIEMVGEKVIRDMYDRHLKPEDDNSN